jgi:acetolactate synthase-1/2/3 large subunit
MSLVKTSNIIYNTLKKLNIKHVFGYPGGAVLPFVNEFYKSEKPKFITPKTEAGASFMAEGYAKMLLNKTPGVVVATSGPGATNLVTSLQNALMDGTPLIALTGQVSTTALGTDAFQEADILHITKTCTKWNFMLNEKSNPEKIINQAYNISLEKRPGSVLIDIPKNISNYEINKQNNIDNIIYYDKENYTTSELLNEQIIEKIRKAKNPIIIAGQGIMDRESVILLRYFARKNIIPVTTTLLGLGAENELSDTSMEMLGMHGSYTANTTVQNADLILVLGARLDDRMTGDFESFGKRAKDIIHVDIRLENKHKTIKKTTFVNSRVINILRQLEDVNTPSEIKDIRKDWLNNINNLKKQNPFKIVKNKTVLGGSEVLHYINNIIHKNKHKKYCIVTDVGAHQMWAAQYIKYDFPRVKFITSGGLGSMGYGLPAAMGAKIANPDYEVICIVGDGGFNMSLQEVRTLVDYNIDVKVFVFNNGYQQMVRMWQDYFYDKRYVGVKNLNPKYDKVAESFGVFGTTLDKKNINKLENIMNMKRPVVIDTIINKEEYVYPMVAPGKALDEMIKE